MSLVTTPTTTLLNIQHPILLAGMGYTSGPELVAAVSNAGGLGVIGGVGYTPDMLRDMIADVKARLRHPGVPFGVDLLLPQIGGSARRTNVDYTKGQLRELIDIVIEGGVKVFVSAVGVPPKEVVERLHAAGVLYMVSSSYLVGESVWNCVLIDVEYGRPSKGMQVSTMEITL
jgi:NAD(P)H-dependent flavin oxidoreductase YrpB (nitropropane dioxygenase family)